MMIDHYIYYDPRRCTEYTMRDEIEPMVPVMPTDDEPTTPIRSDGGARKRYDAGEVEAPLVPDLR